MITLPLHVGEIEDRLYGQSEGGKEHPHYQHSFVKISLLKMFKEI